jgi:hypothetical protein
MSQILNGAIAALVIGGAAFLGQSPGVDQPAPPPPAAVVDDQPAADDGCDHPNISPGDHPYSAAEVAKLTAMATAQCRAIGDALGSRTTGGPPSDDEMCDVLRQVSGDPTATCHRH